MTPPFYISTFGENALSLVIKLCFEGFFSDIHNKSHVKYLFRYLRNLGAKTILCETDYVDRDFLEDYSSYYVRCFNRYSKRCGRLHFFSDDFDYDKFRGCIERNNEEDISSLRDSYLGFVVIKPLSQTFIGRTCLRVQRDLDDKNNRRILKKTYTTNLYGLSLEVESVAFQEQDKVLSACATTALWSIFHASSHFAKGGIPSPSEITLNALSDRPFLINGFPSRGLQASEVIRALEFYKLKCHEAKVAFDKRNGVSDFSQKVRYSIDSGIPLFVGGTVYRQLDDSASDFKILGDHAVALLGYREKTEDLKDDSLTEEILDSVYMHDDRVGPFLRGKFVSRAEQSNNKLFDTFDSVLFLGDCQQVDQPKKGTEYFVPTICVSALPPKVRVSEGIVHTTCEQISTITDKIVPKWNKIKWRVLLKSSSTLKNEYANSQLIDQSCRYSVLIQHWPKHLIIAEAREGDKRLFDLIYDATEAPTGPAFVAPVLFDEEAFNELFGPIVQIKPSDAAPTGSDGVSSFFKHTIQSMSRPSSDHEEKLDFFYGELRPPVKIKDTELGNYDIELQDRSREYMVNDSHDNLLKELKDKGKLIWVINDKGSIVLGEDLSGQGHPTLTGGKAARLGGEIWVAGEDTVMINAHSGRYSSTYEPSDKERLLGNALKLFDSIFLGIKFQSTEKRPPRN